MENTFHCSVFTRSNEAKLPGTMNPYQHALLLEYPLMFAQKPMGGAQLPEGVKERVLEIEKVLKAQGGVKLLLIRNVETAKKAPEDLRLWYISDFGKQPRVVSMPQIELPHQSADQLIAELTEGVTHVGDYPQYLICTNGKRDKCCARFGFPIYRSLAKRLNATPDKVWECSHVGGHHFAANVITFPDAIMYGHVDESDLDRLVDYTETHKVLLSKYRGKAILPKIAQIAEHAVLTGQGWDDALAFSKGEVDLEGDRASVQLMGPAGRFELELSRFEITVPASCEDGTTKQSDYWQVERLVALT